MNTNLDNSLKGLGGAPTRATTLPESAAERKKFPVASGVLDYFPDAIVAISELSQKGNDQHNPGKPLHWDRSKSGDEADTLARHFLQRGTRDTDGIRHSAKMAWRALALLQKEIESETAVEVPASEYPKYFSAGRFLYRARWKDDLGQYWLNGAWRNSVAEPPIERYGFASSITAEEARERGVEV